MKGLYHIIFRPLGKRFPYHIFTADRRYDDTSGSFLPRCMLEKAEAVLTGHNKVQHGDIVRFERAVFRRFPHTAGAVHPPHFLLPDKEPLHFLCLPGIVIYQ